MQIMDRIKYFVGLIILGLPAYLVQYRMYTINMSIIITDEIEIQILPQKINQYYIKKLSLIM